MQICHAGGIRWLAQILSSRPGNQLSNPKTAVAYASIFTALLPADTPSWIAWVILPMIFLFETGWYAVVAIVFSSEGPRSSYLGGKIWLDRLAAGILGLLGVKLISEAR